MNWQQRLLSALVAFAFACSEAILPRIACYAALFVAGGACVWRRRRRPPGSLPLLATHRIVVASGVGVLSVGCAYLRGIDRRTARFLERSRGLNSRNGHSLHPSRAVRHGLEYVDGQWIQTTYDEKGAPADEIVRFRGVNLPAKTPAVPPANAGDDVHASKGDVSFVGRPFPLEEAPAHFRRLGHDWGFNLVRLSTSWEAVMHEGPGVLDAEYLDYLRQLVELAGDFGLYVLIDPHQDVWSRFTGGDGMPRWTLDAAGFDTRGPALHDTGSAVLEQFWNASDGPMPNMLWTSNYWKLAAATMFTLFFAGDVYAPGIAAEDSPLADGPTKETIQQFLQRHYFRFIDAVAEAVEECPNVIGFGTMNEPSNGFVGIGDIREIHAPVLHGHVTSAFDGMRLAGGEALTVPYYPSPFRYGGRRVVNARRHTAYKTPELDIWQRVGVYKIDERTNERVLLRPHHFALQPGEDFVKRYMAPFYASMKRIVSRHNARLVTYAEPYFDPDDPFPSAPSEWADNSSVGWAPHWYDAVTLFLGYYSRWWSFDFAWKLPVVGPALVDWTFRKNLSRLKRRGKGRPSDAVHVLVGETGAPFTNHDDFTLALDRTLRAVESNDLDYALWCYESRNDAVGGDGWNDEDLSLWSEERGRGLAAAVRPYPFRYSVGLTVESQAFDPIGETYRLVILDAVNNKDYTATLFLFVPSSFKDPQFEVSAGSVNYERSSQNLVWQVQRRSMGFYRLDISEKNSFLNP